MTRKSPFLAIEEMSGNEFSNLRAAQKSAIRSIVPGLAATLHALLDKNLLIEADGRIIPNIERRSK
jgi:hypothetical protein